MPLLGRRTDQVEMLATVPLFAGLSKKDLGALARRVGERDVSPGTVLIAEGEAAGEAYVILDGAATVRRGGRKVAELGPGDVVGEMSLITDRPRNATVTADTFMVVLVLMRADLDAVIDAHPTVAVKLLRTVARRLQEAMR